jgi:hypothetical protein
MSDRAGIIVSLVIIAFIVALHFLLEPKDKATAPKENTAADKYAACRAAGGVPVISADNRIECLKGAKP